MREQNIYGQFWWSDLWERNSTIWCQSS